MNALEKVVYDKISLLISFKSPVALQRHKTAYKIKNEESYILAAKYVANFLYKHKLERALYTASIETDGFIPKTKLPRYIPLNGKITDISSVIEKPESSHGHHSHSHSHHHHHHSSHVSKTDGVGEVKRPFFQFSEPELTYKEKKKLFQKRQTYVDQDTMVDPNDMAMAKVRYKIFLQNREKYTLPQKEEVMEKQNEEKEEAKEIKEDPHKEKEEEEKNEKPEKEEQKDEDTKDKPQTPESSQGTRKKRSKTKVSSPYRRKCPVIRISQSKDID